MIIIKNFSFAYPCEQVLKNINLQYQPGGIYYLLAPNGFGKSTLLRSMAGLHKPSSGSIKVGNYNAVDRPIKMLQDLCFISEDTYFPNMQISDFPVLYGLLYPKFNTTHFYNYLEKFEVEKGNWLSALSFGQIKKLHLAFAFATNADVILLDEPTNGLDINSKMQFRKILATIINGDKTIIISTHDVVDMDILADGITVLRNETVVFHQKTADILKKIYFDFTTDKSEAEEALYSEQTYYGFMTIKTNFMAHESNLNMELLYRGLLNQPQKITALFT
ncbi:ATP-binding cassette domain-containing protein [Chryseobacterium sp. CBSDS_008]|uniref:ATP-binding cassette domain-containing protein n=1 Tax=Chryseobacterium sp. CBSDS_008 TaxID=3415265 RepID=UPI003CEB3A80